MQQRREERGKAIEWWIFNQFFVRRRREEKGEGGWIEEGTDRDEERAGKEGNRRCAGGQEVVLGISNNY